MSASDSWFDFGFFNTCCGTSSNHQQEEMEMEIRDLSPSNDEERRAAPGKGFFHKIFVQFYDVIDISKRYAEILVGLDFPMFYFSIKKCVCSSAWRF